jgi:hypothetical protein
MKGLVATMQEQQAEATRLERIKADVEAASAG